MARFESQSCGFKSQTGFWLGLSSSTWVQVPTEVNDFTTRARLSGSLSPTVCLSAHTILLFLLISTLPVSLLSIFVGILFLKSQMARALSLTTGLAARIRCFHCQDWTSIWWETEAWLQAAASRCHLRSYLVPKPRNSGSQGNLQAPPSLGLRQPTFTLACFLLVSTLFSF